MPSDMIRTHDEGAVRTITLQRPEKKNALTLAMYEALIEALRQSDEDAAIRVIMMTGAGQDFTAGNDLADFMAAGPSKVEESAPIRLLMQLVEQKKPLVVRVDGVAVGIGTTLLLHADYIVASDRARFRLPFINLGLCPEGGSSVLLPQAVGLARATEWLMFGDFVSAAEALEAGLINKVVPADQLTQTVAERVHALAEKPLGSLILTKQLLRGPLRETREAIYREGEHFLARLQSPEAAEAFAAFFAKKR